LAFLFAEALKNTGDLEDSQSLEQSLATADSDDKEDDNEDESREEDSEEESSEVPEVSDDDYEESEGDLDEDEEEDEDEEDEDEEDEGEESDEDEDEDEDEDDEDDEDEDEDEDEEQTFKAASKRRVSKVKAAVPDPEFVPVKWICNKVIIREKVPFGQVGMHCMVSCWQVVPPQSVCGGRQDFVELLFRLAKDYKGYFSLTYTDADNGTRFVSRGVKFAQECVVGRRPRQYSHTNALD
jgi:hypothetical protein